MKSKIFAIFFLASLAIAYPVEIALTEADIKGFNDRHTQDTSVLFFVNLASQEESGFWASIFNLFGSSSESDESYLDEIAENNPVMKIDIGKETLAHAAEDYKVDSVPFVVALNKGEQIVREKPNSKTADNIDAIVKDREEKRLKEIDHATTVHPERDASKVDINEEKSDTDVHHHQKPLVIIPDFGHLQLNDLAPNLINSKPVQTLDTKTGANIDSSKPVTVEQETDTLVEYKLKNQPTVEDKAASSAVSAKPKFRPTDGNRAIPSTAAAAPTPAVTTRTATAATVGSSAPAPRSSTPTSRASGGSSRITSSPVSGSAAVSTSRSSPTPGTVQWRISNPYGNSNVNRRR